MRRTAGGFSGRASRRARLTLADVGEFGFLDALLPTLGSGSAAVEIGVGDDCAVVAAPAGPLVLTTDTLVEDTHFRRDWLAARQLGRRAFLVNASDVAAMGGRPLWALVSLCAPADRAQHELLELMAGIAEAAREANAAVVGGNLSLAPTLSVAVTLVGTLETAPLTRSGARPGDRLFVTGALGGAAYAVRELLAGRRPGARSRAMRAWAEPPARVGLGPALAATGAVSAMIDLSDGFVQDLGHVLAASGVGAEIDVAALPTCAGVRLPRAGRLALAASGGEDYELLFAVPPGGAARVRQVGRRLGVPLTEVGVIVAGRGLRATEPRWQTLLDAARGHDHFHGSSGRRRAARDGC